MYVLTLTKTVLGYTFHPLIWSPWQELQQRVSPPVVQNRKQNNLHRKPVWVTGLPDGLFSNQKSQFV
jgi:hypothetical protein